MASQTAFGISVCNPTDIEKEYLEHTVNYAIENKYNHFQFIGPIHNPVRGNIDGMTFYDKYSRFNDEKDAEYVKLNLDLVNKACEKLHANGVKTYMWHHELELPVAFTKAFPETLNQDGDIEVSHPLVKDFLEHKIKDFFTAYPLMDGIILTLHETRVPLLKLKNQKLGKVERVKYVTQTLFNTCKELKKELICRPFASIEEDYEMMTKAYEEISTDMVIMDKWTQFDWSLTLPDNKFFSKIKHNPLLVETDIFGEYFGKGRFPLMLKEHIENKYEYCTSFSSFCGFCNRIDRAGRHPFGDVNEVNLDIMNACMKGENVDDAIDNFFINKYGKHGLEVRKIMENTEEILRRTIYLQEFYFSELSLFPQLNHCKNHFYFEMMREDYSLCSGEWFIPIGWKRGSLNSVIEEKDSAVEMAQSAFDGLLALEGKIEQTEYQKLLIKFKNLKYCTQIWKELVNVFINYAKFFELKDCSYQEKLQDSLEKLLKLNDLATADLGADFYCKQGDKILVSAKSFDFVEDFVRNVNESFQIEKEEFTKLDSLNLYDYVICGGGSEHHKIKKEVNFSDTMVNRNKLARIPGSNRGRGWSSINTHGWFSYEVALKPNHDNLITVEIGSELERLDLKITIGENEHVISEEFVGVKEVSFPYHANEQTAVRVRFDRISSFTPLVYTIKVTN